MSYTVILIMKSHNSHIWRVWETLMLTLTPWRKCPGMNPSFMIGLSLLHHSSSFHFSAFPFLSLRRADPQAFPSFPQQRSPIIPKCSRCCAGIFTFCLQYPDLPPPGSSLMLEYESGQHHPTICTTACPWLSLYLLI